MDGEVVEVNAALADNPALVNQAAVRRRLADPARARRDAADLDRLLTSAAYEKLVEEQHA